jgi:hypothetical protein
LTLPAGGWGQLGLLVFWSAQTIAGESLVAKPDEGDDAITKDVMQITVVMRLIDGKLVIGLSPKPSSRPRSPLRLEVVQFRTWLHDTVTSSTFYSNWQRRAMLIPFAVSPFATFALRRIG